MQSVCFDFLFSYTSSVTERKFWNV